VRLLLHLLQRECQLLKRLLPLQSHKFLISPCQCLDRLKAHLLHKPLDRLPDRLSDLVLFPVSIDKICQTEMILTAIPEILMEVPATILSGRKNGKKTKRAIRSTTREFVKN
jgi:hypothetical protein